LLYLFADLGVDGALASDMASEDCVVGREDSASGWDDPCGVCGRGDFERKPNDSNIISSSSSVTWLTAPLARCSASLDLRSSTETGSPVEVRSRVNRLERLRRMSAC
jgi:hypothetical protein